MRLSCGCIPIYTAEEEKEKEEEEEEEEERDCKETEVFASIETLVIHNVAMSNPYLNG